MSRTGVVNFAQLLVGGCARASRKESTWWRWWWCNVRCWPGSMHTTGPQLELQNTAAKDNLQCAGQLQDHTGCSIRTDRRKQQLHSGCSLAHDHSRPTRFRLSRPPMLTVYSSSSDTPPVGTNATQRYYTLNIFTAYFQSPRSALAHEQVPTRPGRRAPRTDSCPDPGSPSPSSPFCQSCSATGRALCSPCSWWR